MAGTGTGSQVTWQVQEYINSGNLTGNTGSQVVWYVQLQVVR